MSLTHFSLFTGIGGLDLAAEWAGIETVGQCEFADYPTKVLEKHWPEVPRWRDIRTLTGESFYERTGLHTVDVISGGFPCQPFSNAGKRRGKEDDRYLWPEMVRVIAELRPTWVVGENVAGIIHMALDTVLSDLEGQGYATRAFLIPASGVNAPHQRYRTAIVAYTDCAGLQTSRAEQQATGASGNGEGKVCNTTGQGLPDRTSQPMERYKTQEPESQRPDCHVPYSDNGSWTLWRDRKLSAVKEIGGKWNHNGGGAQEYVTREWWAVEPNVDRVANGVPHRVDRLKCLGNAVVPQQFYPIFKAIAEIETEIQN